MSTRRLRPCARCGTLPMAAPPQRCLPPPPRRRLGSAFRARQICRQDQCLALPPGAPTHLPISLKLASPAMLKDLIGLQPRVRGVSNWLKLRSSGRNTHFSSILNLSISPIHSGLPFLAASGTQTAASPTWRSLHWHSAQRRRWASTASRPQRFLLPSQCCRPPLCGGSSSRKARPSDSHVIRDAQFWCHIISRC